MRMFLAMTSFTISTVDLVNEVFAKKIRNRGLVDGWACSGSWTGSRPRPRAGPAIDRATVRSFGLVAGPSQRRGSPPGKVCRQTGDVARRGVVLADWVVALLASVRVASKRSARTMSRRHFF